MSEYKHICFIVNRIWVYEIFQSIAFIYVLHRVPNSQSQSSVIKPGFKHCCVQLHVVI